MTRGRCGRRHRRPASSAAARASCEEKASHSRVPAPMAANRGLRRRALACVPIASRTVRIRHPTHLSHKVMGTGHARPGPLWVQAEGKALEVLAMRVRSADHAPAGFLLAHSRVSGAGVLEARPARVRRNTGAVTGNAHAPDAKGLGRKPVAEQAGVASDFALTGRRIATRGGRQD